MEPEERDRRRERFRALCRQEGLPLTVQRREILDAVLDHDDHATVDEVLEIVRRAVPGISRASVHRTLETLVRFGLLVKAGVPGRATRYDTRLDRHHHLFCDACDAVIDVSDPLLSDLPVPDTSHLGFEVRDFIVQLRGLCRSCRAARTRRGRSRGSTRPSGRKEVTRCGSKGRRRSSSPGR